MHGLGMLHRLTRLLLKRLLLLAFCSTAQTCFPPPSPNFLFAAGNCQTGTCGSRISSLEAANAFVSLNNSALYWSLKAMPAGMSDTQWLAYVNNMDNW